MTHSPDADQISLSGNRVAPSERFLPTSIVAAVLLGGLIPFLYAVWLFIAQGGDPPTIEVRQMQGAVRPWWLFLLAIAACGVPLTRVRKHRQTALVTVFLIVYFIAAGYFYL